MYRIILGKASVLSAGTLPAALSEQAPQSTRRARWLAGHVLLPHALSLLSDIVYDEQEKPAFSVNIPLRLSLSHSGDGTALPLSDEGEVGCDIEVVRLCDDRQTLANAISSLDEHAGVEAKRSEQQLAAFWCIWTHKKATVRQCGGSAR